MTTVASNLIPTRVTSLPSYAGSDTSGTIYYVLSGVSYQAQLSTLFAAVGGGTVTSIDVSGGATGLSFTGGPVTLSGTITASGTLVVANGGTGAATAAGARTNLLPSFAGNAGKGLVVNAGATDVEFATLATGTVTSVDVSGGSTGLSASGGPVTGTGTVTLDGTLVVAHGGTGAGNAAGARSNLLPAYAGHAGEVLAVNAGATDVEYITVAGSGTVTSVDISGGTTGLTSSGGPITTAGSLTLGGTLAVANGGTGQTSYTNGQLLIGNTTGNTLAKGTLTPSAGISITNGAGAITVATAITTLGDLLVGTGANAASRLAIGTNGQVATVVGGTVAWATPSSSTWTQIGTQSISGSGPWSFTSIGNSYGDLLLVLDLTPSTSQAVFINLSADGVSWGANATFGSGVATAFIGGLLIPHYQADYGMMTGSTVAVGASPDNPGAVARPFNWRITGGIDALRFAINTGTTSGTATLYGR